MSQTTSKTFDDRTDKVSTITHILYNTLINNNQKAIPLSLARQEVMETLEDNNVSQSELTPDEFDSIVQKEDNFDLRVTNGNPEIIDVQTLGSPPEFLGIEDLSGNTQTYNPGNNDPNSTHDREDDFTRLDSLEHQEQIAGLLKDEGYKTFEALSSATVDELSDYQVIPESLAVDIIEDASHKISPTESLYRKCLNEEMQDFDDEGSGDYSILGETEDITEVPIGVGKPREASDLKGTTLQHRVITDEYSLALPILHKPVFNTQNITDIANQCDTFEEFLHNIRHFCAFDIQAQGFTDGLRDEFEDVEDLIEAGSIPRITNRFTTHIEQPGITPETLKSAINEIDEQDITQASRYEVTEKIDYHLQGEAPERSRIKIAKAIQRELEQDITKAELVEQDRLEDIANASTTPAEIEHPYIPDLSEYPEYRTRERANGEKDIEAADKILAYNRHALDLVGHAGVGKDSLVKYIAGSTNRALITMEMDQSMVSQQLLGKHVFKDGENLEFEDGPLPHCAKYGYMMCISEANAATSDILTALHGALEQNGKIHIKDSDEIINPANTFRLITTRNPPTSDYQHAKELNGAFKRRLNSLWLGYLPKQMEVALLDEIVNEHRAVIRADDIERLVEFANQYRNDNPDNNIPRVSTTDLQHIAEQADGTGELAHTAADYLKAKLSRRQHSNNVEQTLQNIRAAI